MGQKYICTKCKAEDYDNSDHPVTGPLNCWHCGAGRGVPHEQMIAARTGMWPVAPVEEPQHKTLAKK